MALPLALGGAHPEVNAIAAITTIVLLHYFLRRKDKDTPLAANLPTVVLGAALAMTLLQLLPLPVALLRWIAPRTAELVTLPPLPAPTFATLSLDAPATAHEAIKLVLYLGGSLLALSLFADKRRERELFSWIGLAGTAVAALGLLHALARLDRPFGAFGLPSEGLVSTFINPNHLAGFAGLASFVSLGLALANRGTLRAVWAVNGALTGAVVFLSLSRGGTLAYLGAVLFFAVPVALDRPERKHNLLWVQLGLVGAILTAAYVAYANIVHELWTLGRPDAFSKAQIWAPVWTMVQDFSAWGVGRGAMAGIYTLYSPFADTVTFTHLENEWLQPFVDWGLPMGLLFVGAIGFCFVQALRRAVGKPARLGAVTGLLFLGVHNLGDFNLTLSAVALPAWMMLTVLATQPSHSDTKEKSKRWLERLGNLRPSYNVGMLGAAVLSILVVVCAVPAIRFTSARDTQRLHQLLVAYPKQIPQLETIHTILARHPADAMLPLSTAERLLAIPAQRPLALRFVNRGLYLAPRYYGGHLLAARALMTLGHTNQALLEYRTVAELEPHRIAVLAEEVFAHTRSLGTVQQLATTSTDVRLGIANFLLRQHAAEEALAVLDAAPQVETPAAFELAVRALFETGHAADAAARAEDAARRWPGQTSAYLVQGQVLASRGETSDALAVLQKGIESAVDPTPLYQQVIGLLIQQQRYEEAKRYAKRLLDNLAPGPAKAQATWLLGDIHAREGARATALREYQKARDLDPTNVNYRVGIANLREAMGDLGGAKNELESAAAYAPAGSGVREALERLKGRMQQAEDRLRNEVFLKPPP